MGSVCRPRLKPIEPGLSRMATLWFGALGNLDLCSCHVALLLHRFYV